MTTPTNWPLDQYGREIPPPPPPPFAANPTPFAVPATITPYAMPGPSGFTIQTRHVVAVVVAAVLVVAGVMIGSHHSKPADTTPKVGTTTQTTTSTSTDTHTGCGPNAGTNKESCYDLGYSVNRESAYETLGGPDGGLDMAEALQSDPSTITDLCGPQAQGITSDPVQQADYLKGCTQGDIDAIAQYVDEGGTGSGA